MKMNGTPPIYKKAYHYTSLEGFKKIIQSNEFILSLFEKANDHKEMLSREFSDGDSIKNYRYISTVADLSDNGSDLHSFGNSMMWYLYGHDYKGVCIEFDIEKLNNLNPIRSGKIRYRNGVTHIDNQDIKDYLMEKRVCWNGENEYRFLFCADTYSIKNIKEYISAIYFGCEVEKSEIKNYADLDCELYETYFDSWDGRVLKKISCPELECCY